jgi:hypothetical protein
MCAGTPNPKQPPKRLKSKSTKIQIGIANSQTTLPSSRSSEYQKKNPTTTTTTMTRSRTRQTHLTELTEEKKEVKRWRGQERSGRRWMESSHSVASLLPSTPPSTVVPYSILISSHPHRIPPATRCSSSSPLRSLLQYYSSSNTRTGLVDSQIGLLVRINCVVERVWP